MSSARRPSRRSISSRIAIDQGSAPKRPYASACSRGSIPASAIVSAMCSAYDGVQQRIRAERSAISSTWRGVLPPDAGTTIAPIRSAP